MQLASARRANCFTFSLILLCLSLRVFSQDANYWTSPYGPGGYFLPGAVIADNKDSGVLFVNPALLANSKIMALSANATIYHTDKINIQNGAGSGFDLKSNSAGAIPAMVAGNFRLPFKKKHIIIAYGIIQPPAFNFSASQKRDQKFNVLNDGYSPGPETFVGQYLDENSSSNFKLLAAAAWKISGNFSAGITLEGNRHTQTLDQDYYARVLINPLTGTPYTLVGIDASYYVSYATLGLIPKTGFAWNSGKSSAGVTVTFPLIDFGGKGLLLADNVIYNLDISGTGNEPLNFFANTRQDNLKAHWKAPLSIAAGFTQDFNKWQLYIAAEYFNRIKEYNIIKPRQEYFLRPDTGNTDIFTADLLKFKDARKAVLNVAAGFKYAFSEKYNFYFSARSDNTYHDDKLYADSTDGVIPNTSKWNLYHLQLGLNLKKQKFNLRGGIYSSFGFTKHYQSRINFDNPSENNFLLGLPISTKANYFSIGLMISYVHNL